ncbi:MAG TPA: DUF5668 domain-containing protein [Anaerolineaceae bacterium]
MRRSSVFWGTILLLVGVAFLLQTLGIITISVWGILFPAFLIVVGAYIIFAPILFKRDLKEEQVVIPLNSAPEASIKLDFGAGRLAITGGAGSDLLTGKAFGGAEVETERDGNRLKARLHIPETWFWGWTPEMRHGYEWNFLLTEAIPLSLKINTGASENKLDLTTLRVNKLKVDTGASSTSITLPATAGFTEVRIQSGAASIDLHAPQGIAVRMKVEGALSNTQVDTQRFPRVGNLWVSPDFETAANRADVVVQIGAGSVRLD